MQTGIRHRKRPLLFAVGIALALFTYTGCEDEPSDDGIDDYFTDNPYQSDSRQTPQGSSSTLSISPVAASAGPGQLINFTANGGASPFSWSVGTPANGTVTEQGNERYGIYTHLGTTNDFNNVVVTDGAGSTAIANIN